MKQLKYISIISIMALITAPAVADIASAEYVDNVVGTMTQSAINTALSNKQDKLPTAPNDGKKYSLIWNGSGFAFEEFTTGGGSTGLQCDATPLSGCRYFEGEYSCNTYPEYDIGFGQCISTKDNGVDSATFSHNGDFDYGGTEYGLSPGEWLSVFSYGTIKGRASCNNTPGYSGDNYDWTNDNSEWLRPADTFDNSATGPYCWCQIISPVESGWVFVNDEYGSATGCANHCVEDCVLSSDPDPHERFALFSAVGD